MMYPEYQSDRKLFFDIPVDEDVLADVEVCIVEPQNSNDTEKLYDDTRIIYEQFNPNKVVSCKDAASESTYTAQSLFYTTVRPGCETVGIELEHPSVIYANLPSHPAKAPIPFPTDMATADGGGSAEGLAHFGSQKKSDVSLPPHISPPASIQESLSFTMEDAVEPITDYDFIGDVPSLLSQTQFEHIHESFQALYQRVSILEAHKKKTEYPDLHREVENLKKGMEQLSRQLKSLEGQFQQLYHQQEGILRNRSGDAHALNGAADVSDARITEHDDSFQKTNLAFLGSLDIIQVSR